MIVPIPPSGFDVRMAKATLGQIPAQTQVRGLVNKVFQGSKATELVEEIVSQLGIERFKTELKTRVCYTYLPLQGISALTGPATKEIGSLTKEIIDV